jgi:hypothetical protein
MPASFLIEAVGRWENSARPGLARLTTEIESRCGSSLILEPECRILTKPPSRQDGSLRELHLTALLTPTRPAIYLTHWLINLPV